MYLKSVKLAGFKSFVDPTSITIRSHMSAVVGPNGCGKSNIVDAIRWVIGESSAKQLRGQSMSDVIFNGTTHRKSVGRAMVELHFDNSAGRVVGEYAKFSELVIRREVEHEGQSTYFLNGSHCRRRDIVDLFLGTGLGSRSYSIIEQGMISQLVEAKPEDLRIHLEEVAGISKYKERRRETETRIRHTQENLDRLNDIRDELDKQLRHLKRQANAAERYKVFKQEARELSAQIKALSWRQLEDKRSTQQERITATSLRYEHKVARQRGLEADIDKIRVEREQAEQQQQEVQKRYYGQGEAIARLEQQIQHHQDQIHRWQQELADTNVLWEELSESSAEHKEQLNALETELGGLSPQTGSAQAVALQAQRQLADAEARMQLWQKDWDRFQNQAAEVNSKTRVNATRIEHLQAQLQQMSERQEKMTARMSELPINVLQQALQPLKQRVTDLLDQQVATKDALAAQQEKLQQQRQANKRHKQAVEEQRRQLQAFEAQQARLSAVQQAVLGVDDAANKEWLTHNKLDQRARLGQQIKVKPGWEKAVETVLSGYFDAICVEEIGEFAHQFSELNAGRVTLIEQARGDTGPLVDDQPKLCDQIASDWPCDQWLQAIYVAENLEEAFRRRESLEDQQSVITKEGVWVGKHWLRVSKVEDPQSGIFERERQLKLLEQQVKTARKQLDGLENQLEMNEQAMAALEQEREDLQQRLEAINVEFAQAQANCNKHEAQLENRQTEVARLQTELTELHERVAAQDIALQQSKQQQATLSNQSHSVEQNRQRLLSERAQCEAQLSQARENAQYHKQQADALEIRIGANESQLALLRQTIERNAKQRAQLTEKREFLTSHLSQDDSPLQALKLQLQGHLEARLTVEQELQQCEQRVTNARSRLRGLEQDKQTTVDEIAAIQSELEQLRLSDQAVLVRQQTLKEQLEADKLTLEAVCASLPEEAEIKAWEEKLTALMNRIQRLGPINLAAIEEFEQGSERKAYLDSQFADLTESLETLQAAIQKIDRETKQRFRDTFEVVNKGFKENFPRIFGGGSACLELSDDDWLTTGVLVRAQPPGKRNSTIHLLSGGEKALTAIALVFAIFQLNPAPFCILDEVDAPLDDLNVNRFCQLVKEMAKETQFLIISHNKVTIEMADHLMGVTMQEPGVSRLVAVDIEEALELVES